MKKFDKLSWIINNSCNLACVHCYPNSGIETKKRFNDDEFEKIRKNFKGIHFSRVYLSGGEPILDTNFYKYLKIALEISDDVYICSNGTLLSDKKLYELVHAGVKGIILSLQALDSELSSKIYGNSNVPKLVFSAIERIKKYDLSLGVEMTIMKYNIEIINDLVLELIKHNVNFISFKRLLPVGRGADENIRVSKEEQYEALNKIFSLQISNPNIRFNVHDPLYGTILYDNFSELTNNETVLNWIKSFSCRAGTRWLGIDPNGNVSPCPILLYKDLLIGNILDAPLVKILEESPLIKTFESLSKYKSNSCKYSSYCLGCRATAVSQTNCVDSKDPMCIHESEKCPINDLYRRS